MFATPEICKNALFSCIIFRTKLSKISFCPNLSTRTPIYCYCISTSPQHIVVSCPYNKSGTNNQMYPNVFQYIYGIKKRADSHLLFLQYISFVPCSLRLLNPSLFREVIFLQIKARYILFFIIDSRHGVRQRQIHPILSHDRMNELLAM